MPTLAVTTPTSQVPHLRTSLTRVPWALPPSCTSLGGTHSGPSEPNSKTWPFEVRMRESIVEGKKTFETSSDTDDN